MVCGIVAMVECSSNMMHLNVNLFTCLLYRKGLIIFLGPMAQNIILKNRLRSVTSFWSIMTNYLNYSFCKSVISRWIGALLCRFLRSKILECLSFRAA